MLLSKMNKKLSISSICDIFIDESGIFLEMLIIGFILPRLVDMQIVNKQFKEVLNTLLASDIKICTGIDKFSISNVIYICVTMLLLCSISKIAVAYNLSNDFKYHEANIEQSIRNIDLLSHESGTSFKDFLYEKRYKILIAKKTQITFLFQQLAQFLFCLLFEKMFFNSMIYTFFTLPFFFFEILLYYFFLSRQKLKLREELKHLVEKRDLEGLISSYNKYCENNLYNSELAPFKKLKVLQVFRQFLKIIYAIILLALFKSKFITENHSEIILFLEIFFIYLLKNIIISALSTLQFNIQENSSNIKESWRKILGGEFINYTLKYMQAPIDRINIKEINKIFVEGQAIEGNISGLNVILKENINFSLNKGQKAVLFDTSPRSLLPRILKHIAGRTEKKGFLMVEGTNQIIDFMQLSLKSKNRIHYYSPSMKLPLYINVKSETEKLSFEQKNTLLQILGLQEEEIITTGLSKDLENKLKLLICLKNIYNNDCDFIFIDGSLFLLNTREDIENILAFISQCEKGIVISMNKESYIPHLKKYGFEITNFRSTRDEF